jgi:hypothetical protein
MEEEKVSFFSRKIENSVTPSDMAGNETWRQDIATFHSEGNIHVSVDQRPS